MSFNKSKCIIRKTYCGAGNIPKSTNTKKYSRHGTRYECLKKGYGLADWEHRKKDLSVNSLQQIMYIGPKYEQNFKKQKITNINSLLKKFEKLNKKDKKDILNKVLSRTNGSIDQKAINSVILFLHNKGQKNLPDCVIVNE